MLLQCDVALVQCIDSCVAVCCCSVLFQSVVEFLLAEPTTATRCNTTKHTEATQCQNTLKQHSATTHCNTRVYVPAVLVVLTETTTATHCNTLQHTATHCNTLLQHTATTHCNTRVYLPEVLAETTTQQGGKFRL